MALPPGGGGASSGGVRALRVAVGLNLEDPPLGVGENGPGQRPGPRVWPGAEEPTQGGLGGIPAALQSLGRERPTRVLGLGTVWCRGLNKRQLSTVYNSQDVKATWMSTGRRMIRKLCYIYTMEYYLAVKKNTFESVLMWMKLEPIIQSEVSQKEKHQYRILMHIYGI